MIPGSVIKEIRQSRGITQAALAERLGITAKAVSDWETDRSKCRNLWLSKLAESLGVEPHLIGGRMEKEPLTVTSRTELPVFRSIPPTGPLEAWGHPGEVASVESSLAERGEAIVHVWTDKFAPEFREDDQLLIKSVPSTEFQSSMYRRVEDLRQRAEVVLVRHKGQLLLARFGVAPHNKQLVPMLVPCYPDSDPIVVRVDSEPLFLARVVALVLRHLPSGNPERW